MVLAISNDQRCLTVQRINDGAIYIRHPDDIKKFDGIRTHRTTPHHSSEREVLQQYIKTMAQLTNELEESIESLSVQLPTPTHNTNTRVTRSQGQSLNWNPTMNPDNLLLPAAENSAQLNVIESQEHWV